jgi:hypothetical protein
MFTVVAPRIGAGVDFVLEGEIASGTPSPDLESGKGRMTRPIARCYFTEAVGTEFFCFLSFY